MPGHYAFSGFFATIEEPLPHEGEACYTMRIMTIAVISDIHANLEALQSVLKDIDAHNPEMIFSCGDSVGYGADPEAVVAILRERGIRQVLGNHELGCLKAMERAWFNPQALKAINKTRLMLSKETLEYFKTLSLYHAPDTPPLHNCYFVHGTPPDSAKKYLFELEDEELPQLFEHTMGRICFLGHTHELALVSMPASGPDKGVATREIIEQGHYTLDPAARHIVNVGSVGQPRDGDNNAKYVLWDPKKHLLEVRYIPYDVHTAVDKIIAKGLPEQYARRLL